MKILLGSESPRRKELLKELGYDFTPVKINCEEIYPESLNIKKIAAFLSELKSAAYGKVEQDEVLITADTIVVINGEILGKPKDREEATVMLRKLSGKNHEVHTAVSIRTDKKLLTKTDIATVILNELSATEIDYYISNFNVMDKAGSYGIQDWLGMAKINKIEGSFYTIMGFPTHLVYQMLQDLV